MQCATILPQKLSLKIGLIFYGKKGIQSSKKWPLRVQRNDER